MNEGWICPVCKSIYAPYFPWCLKCNNFTNIIQKEEVIDNNFLLENKKKEEIEENEIIEKNEEKDELLRKNKNLIIPQIDIEIPVLNKEPIYEIPNKYPDTKIFLSGIGHAKERAVKRNFIIPYILDSIVDFPLKPSKLVKQYFEKIKQDNIEYLMDSGAFTYLASPKKSFDLQAHLDKYCYYINEFDIKNFFELDIDAFLTIDEIENIRKKIYLETHKKPIIVYHPERGHDYWINMCKENDYIAIGGLVTGTSVNNDKRFKELEAMCDEAHRYKTLVHGLGFTPLTLLNSHTLFFDTVDSTSWNCSKNGFSAIINEKGELTKTEIQYYFSSIEAQENDLKIWADFSLNYKGKNK